MNGFRGGALKHKFVECLHEFISFMYVENQLLKSSFRLGLGQKGLELQEKAAFWKWWVCLLSHKVYRNILFYRSIFHAVVYLNGKLRK